MKKFEEIEQLLASIDDLIELKVLVRKIAPTHELRGESLQTFVRTLKSLRSKIEPIFTKYIPESESDQESNLIEKIITLIQEGNFALINSNSAKGKLKNLGIDARKLIVTGGPIKPEDYRVVNPNIPESALKGIQKKCDRIFDEIRSEDWTNKNLLFLYEEENVTDQLILKRIEEISEVIGKEVKVLKFSNWDIFDKIDKKYSNTLK